jgi:diguanylate cyclase (GGDEF)-like protein
MLKIVNNLNSDNTEQLCAWRGEKLPWCAGNAHRGGGFHPYRSSLCMSRPDLSLLRYFLIWLLGLFAACAGAAVPSAQHRFDISAGNSQLTGQVQYQADESHQRQLTDMLSPGGQASFQDADGAVRARLDGWPFWLKISLTQSGGPGDWLLALPTTGIQDLQFFGPFDASGKSLAEPVRTGLAHPFSSRPLGSERFVFLVRLPEAGQYTAYLRLMSRTSQLYKVAAWEPAAYLASRQDKRLFDGLTYGILLALLVHNLVLAIIFRDWTYGFYVPSCGFALLTIASFNGHAARYLFPDWPTAIELSYVVAPALWILSNALFARSFLDLPRLAPWFNLANSAVLGFCGLALFLGLADQVTSAQRLNEIASGVGVIVLFVAAAVVYARGFKPALWYLGGQSMLFLAVVSVVLGNWGLLDSPFMTSNGLQIGIMMELLVFAAALSSRIRLMRAGQVELKKMAGRLAQAAQTDPLTGLANRTGLDLGARILADQAGPHSLMLLDLDQFKPVNDEFGHNAGDAVLQAVARRIQALVRGPDTVARLGGDEFVVLLASTSDPVMLAALAGRLQAAIREPVLFQGQQIQVNSSLGIAVFPQDGKTLTDLMTSADQAMYQAKQAGRGRFAFYTPKDKTH